MKSMKNILTFCGVTLLLMILGTSTSFAGKPAGGGGGKVTVELATPNSVVQTAEEDVVIQGSGFDNGSKIRFLVTGTTDDSQIEVGPAQYISPNELRVHIKTTGSTATVDYDIEVQAASGRKGKGTTLFRVNSTEVCTDSEFPSFAFVKPISTSNSGRGKKNTLIPDGIFLTGNNGCTSYLLLPEYSGQIGKFADLKFTLKNGLGVVTWLEHSELDQSGVSIHRIMGALFDVLPGNVISPAQPQPVVLKEVLQGAGENIYIQRHNIFLDDDSKLHVAFTYIHPYTGGETGLQVVDVDSGVSEVLLSGQYHFLDAQSTPYRAKLQVFWSPDGSELYFQATRIDDEFFEPGVARMIMINGEWQPPQLLVVNHLSVVGWHVRPAGLSPNGVLAYGIEIYDGKNWNFYAGLLDPDDCAILTCDVLDGMPTDGVERFGTPFNWTSSGSLLATRITGLVEYTDAFLGLGKDLVIADGAEVMYLDSSY